MKNIQVISLLARGENAVQEDALLNHLDKGVFVLADGFGAGQVGAQAGKFAVESISSFLVRNSGDIDATLPFVLRRYFSLSGNMAFNALIHANRELIARNRKVSFSEAGGASAVAALLDEDFLAIASVGVCSARLFRAGNAPVLLNRPRSYQQLRNPTAQAGLDREGRARVDLPLMALGMHDHFEPEVFEVQIQKGDWVLFHSDGMTPHLLEQIHALISGVPSVSSTEADQELTKRVNAAVVEASVSDHLAISLVRFS